MLVAMETYPVCVCNTLDSKQFISYYVLYLRIMYILVAVNIGSDYIWWIAKKKTLKI